MSKSNLIVAVCGSGFLFAGVANAEMPSYKYIELAYSTGDLDLSVSQLGSVSIDEDGFELEGSYSFADDRVWLFASYTDLSDDEDFVNIDIETTQLGVGWILPVGDSTSVDLSALYREDDLSIVGASGDVDGLGVAVGIRSMIAERLELYGRLGYLESDYEGGTSLDIGAVVDVSDRFSVTLSYERLDFDDQGIDVELPQIQIGGRFRF